MNAFDNNRPNRKPKKYKGMPDITQYPTTQLIDIVLATNLTTQAQNALNEIKNNRVIKEGDSDDDAAHRGGIRPYHAPTVP